MPHLRIHLFLVPAGGADVCHGVDDGNLWAKRTHAPRITLTLPAFLQSFDNFGVGLAYVIPGFFLFSPAGTSFLLTVVSFSGLGILLCLVLFFESSPPTAPSKEELAKIKHRLQYADHDGVALHRYWIEALRLLDVKGFWQLTVAFVASCVVMNSVASYIDVTIQSDFVGGDLEVRIYCPIVLDGNSFRCALVNRRWRSLGVCFGR